MARAVRNVPSVAALTRLLSPVTRQLHQTRSVETLAFEEVRNSTDRPYDCTAFVLHGLLGSARNWRSFSRSLVSYLSNSAPSSGDGDSTSSMEQVYCGNTAEDPVMEHR